jgi:hypothetical protein
MVYIALVVLCIFLLWWSQEEGFTPNAADVMKHKKLFRPTGTYEEAKSAVEWLDPVVYYDIVDLAHKKRLTPDQVVSVI